MQCVQINYSVVIFRVMWGQMALSLGVGGAIKPEGRETMMRAYRNEYFAHAHLGPRYNDLVFTRSASVVITRKSLQTAVDIEAVELLIGVG